ncbi:TPA: tyrosine-type recombinase/integrase [Escherichia coli]|nr:tyrosine-type recombinase/integrase [Escherichia coli]
MTELLPSKSDICSNAEDSSTDMLLVGFESYMVNEQGLSQGTIRGRMFMIHRYLKACAENAIIDVFSSYAAEEFLKFLRLKKKYSRRSLQYVTYCLRAFFRYGASCGRCNKLLVDCLRSTRVYSLASVPTGPNWSDVRRLISESCGDKPSDIRACAVLMLLTVYGLRPSEVKSLVLSDFDWEHERLTITSTKQIRRKRIFPLSRPVGEAVLRYLQEVRPRSSYKNVFLTLDGTRPIRDIYMLVSRRLKKLNVPLQQYGPRGLRHACATRLMEAGLSLAQIGMHLGHSDVDATRLYAKVNMKALRRVADIDIGEYL